MASDSTSSDSIPAMRTVYRTCPLCEATCGLTITTRGREVVAVRGDRDDVFSHGFICPKGYAVKELDADPDRLRAPMVRRGERWERVSWETAFAEIERGLAPILEQHGRHAVAVYVGNPNAHNLSNMIYLPVFLRALATQNIFSASTVDQMPKQVAAGLMFGTVLSIPVPDVDRTDYLLMLGANPLVSNGSLLTAPDLKGRLRRLRERGGKLVVIDPRRSRTAEVADEHHFIRPGTDALFLFAIVHTLFAEGRVSLGRLAEHTSGVERIEALAQTFAPEVVARVCGLTPETIRRIARELADADHAAVYARIGTCTQEFGTLTSWLVDVVNALTGNLDREGGAMFTKAAAGSRTTSGTPGRGRGVRFGRWKSRVRGLPEVYGELPAACLAEEIDTPGAGQLRALVTIAGNPVLSTPNGGRLRAGLETLDFMVSVDIYLNETTRHANVILPAPSILTRSHYDLALYNLALRNVANYSPPVFARNGGDGDHATDASETPTAAAGAAQGSGGAAFAAEGTAPEMDEWEILLRLTGIVTGQGPTADIAALDDFVIAQLVQREVGAPTSSVAGRDPAELMAALAPRRGPERVLDLMLRTGPYGDGFGRNADGLSLDVLEAHPHGVDLGPLEPRIPEVLRTPSGKIELAPEPIVDDVARLEGALARGVGDLVLVGRRQLRSNNSWMHNLPGLTKGGKDGCTLHLHPDDAARLGLADGATARVTSRVGAVEVPVEVTDAIMPGVVSIPHGWGHGEAGTATRVAAARAGANSNLLADEHAIDPLSGNAVLNGIPVTVAAAG